MFDRYAYLLGMYLGDGWVGSAAGGGRLAISLDRAYPEIIREVVTACEVTVPSAKVTVRPSERSACVTVYSYSRFWLELFPQYGPGRKHEREIRLVDWQHQIVRDFASDFLRGLVHSDGCRTINRFKTKLPSGRVGEYEYPRYFFSNLSQDILCLFTDTCDRLGVRWTMSNHRNISISHRHSVAKLDTFIGPKA